MSSDSIEEVHYFIPNPTCVKHAPDPAHCKICGFTFMENRIYHGAVLDITPTWMEILPELLQGLKVTLDTKGKEGLYLELKRMASAADKWNEYIKEQDASIRD